MQLSQHKTKITTKKTFRPRKTYDFDSLFDFPILKKCIEIRSANIILYNTEMFEF